MIKDFFSSVKLGDVVLCLIISLSLLFVVSCDDEDDITPPVTHGCDENPEINNIVNRSFKMGFSSWAFGPEISDIDETYAFIENNADIISEQMDNKIPWSAWINDTELPAEFIFDVSFRVSKKPAGHKLLLSATLLNTDRTDLLEDYDGTIPEYNQLNDSHIEEAYFKHCKYLLDEFSPDYFVLVLEANELLMNQPNKWEGYKLLMANIRSRIKAIYPNLPISESVTLHNWYNPEVTNPTEYIQEITDYVNLFDFVAISNYPFFKDQHNSTQFQKSFDFLHSKTSKPIALTETNHLAQNLDIPSYDIVISSDTCEQNQYLETVLLNANNNNYMFIIWWSYRDYNKLWETFPEEYKEIGKLWRNTGLITAEGNERPAFKTWNKVYNN